MRRFYGYNRPVTQLERTFSMRTLLAVILAGFTAANAEATWGSYAYSAPHYYHVPMYYQPYYFTPMYYAVPYWCECPPVVAMPSAPPRQETPPMRMPEKPPVKSSGATPETPYSPIVPASGTETPKVEVPPTPKIELPPTPKVETPPVPKVEMKLELPPITPPSPKLELPPLPEKTTSKYGSNREVTLTHLPGSVNEDGTFKLIFQNHTDREVDVMVNGSRMALPAKHTTTASVGRNFRWSLDGGEVSFGSVAKGSRGAELAIK